MAPARQQRLVGFSAAAEMLGGENDGGGRRTRRRTLGATEAKSGGSGVAGVGGRRGDVEDLPLLSSRPPRSLPSPVYILALQYFRSGVICGLERDALI